MNISTSTKMNLAFLTAGLLVGVLIAVPFAWTVKPPQSPSAPLKISAKLTQPQLLARLSKPDQVIQASTKTNGYTVAQFASIERDISGQPKWAVTVYLR